MINRLTGLMLLILFTVFTVSAVLISTALSPNYLLRKYREVDYYGVIESEILSVYRYYGISAGIPDDFFDGFAIDSGRLYSDMVSSVNETFKGREYSPDKEWLKEDLSRRIYSYVEENKIEYAEIEKKAVMNYTSVCIDEYAKKIKMPFQSALLGGLKTARIAVMVLLIVTAVAIVIAMIWIKKRLGWKHRLFERIAHAAFGSAIISFIVWYVFYINRIVERLAISTRSLYMIIVSVVQDIYWDFIFISIGFFVFGLIMTLLYFLRKKYLNKRSGKLVNDAVMHF
jgi:hypothetical protein